MPIITKKSKAKLIEQMNKMTPAARDAVLGQQIADLTATVNAVVADNTAWRAKYATLLAKMDLDAGITDTNYAALAGAAAATATAVTDIGAR